MDYEQYKKQREVLKAEIEALDDEFLSQYPAVETPVEYRGQRYHIAKLDIWFDGVAFTLRKSKKDGSIAKNGKMAYFKKLEDFTVLSE
jgi:hypothetical protein